MAVSVRLVPVGYALWFGEMHDALLDKEAKLPGELELALDRVRGAVARALPWGQPDGAELAAAEFETRDLALLTGAAAAAEMPDLAIAMAILNLSEDADSRVLISRWVEHCRDANDDLVLADRERLAHARILNRIRAITSYCGEREFADAVAAQDPHALVQLADGLTDEGQIDEAERVYRDALATGHARPIERFARWLTQRDRIDEAIQMLREHGAFVELAELLSGRQHPVEEIESVYREALASGSDIAVPAYSSWLEYQGRLAEAEQLLRQAAAGQPLDPSALLDLGLWLDEHDRSDEAGEVYQQAAATGYSEGWYALGIWHSTHGRQVDAEHAYLEAVARGSSEALEALRELLAVG